MKRAQILLDLRCMMRAAIISRVLVPTCFPLSDSFFFFPRRRFDGGAAAVAAEAKLAAGAKRPPDGLRALKVVLDTRFSRPPYSCFCMKASRPSFTGACASALAAGSTAISTVFSVRTTSGMPSLGGNGGGSAGAATCAFRLRFAARADSVGAATPALAGKSARTSGGK